MLQLDGRGYIKGTNTVYKAKVVVLKRFSTKGIIVMPGDIIEDFTGDALLACLASGKVRKWDPEIDDTSTKLSVQEKKADLPAGKAGATDSTQVTAEKLGPKKTRKKTLRQSAIGGQGDKE